MVNDPVNYLDLDGRTRDDIDRMTQHVQETQPDLNVDPHIGTFPRTIGLRYKLLDDLARSLYKFVPDPVCYVCYTCGAAWD